MTDIVGSPEEERRAEFYYQPWSQEAVSRYFYCKVRITWNHMENHMELTVSEMRLAAQYGVLFIIRIHPEFSVSSHFFPQIQQRRQELEQTLAGRNT